MATETPKVKDYLPTEVYAEFERIFEDPETFKPKHDPGLLGKIGLGDDPYKEWDRDYGSLKFDDRSWTVAWKWGDHTTEKTKCLFLLMDSQTKEGKALIVSIFDKSQKEI